MADTQAALRHAGYRLTKPRQAVLAYLRRQREPKTAAEIFRGVGRRLIDLASVYRTVELLERLGLVAREPQGKHAAFALAGAPHHHHIVCRSCERRACLPCEFPALRPRGYVAVQHHLSLSGLCVSCART